MKIITLSLTRFNNTKRSGKFYLKNKTFKFFLYLASVSTSQRSIWVGKVIISLLTDNSDTNLYVDNLKYFDCLSYTQRVVSHKNNCWLVIE